MADASSTDNAALLQQISQLFAASQKSNSSAQKQATAQAIKQLQLQIASNEKIASGNNQSAAQIAAQNNETQKAINAASNATSTANTAANNASAASIAAANNAASITQAQVTGTTQGHIAEMEAQARAALQHEQNQAEADRQTADIQARLQISDREQASQMAQLEKKLGVQKDQMAQDLLISNNTLGFNREQLASNVKIEADKIAQAHEEMLKIGIPAMEANKWYQEQQVTLAQSAQQIDREKIGVDKGRLGFDMLSKATELASNPAARYQLGDFLTGLAKNPNAKDYFSMLAKNSAEGGFGASADAGTGAISPEDAMGNFMSMMGVPPGGGATPPPVQGQTAGAGAAMGAADDGFAAFVGQSGMPQNAEAAQAHMAQLQTQWAAMSPEQKAQYAPAASNKMPIDTSTLQNGTAAAAGGGASNVVGMTPALQAMLAQQQKELTQIGSVRDAGAGALAPGTLEGMSGDDLKAFQGGLAKLGTNPNSWMADYQKTRPGQAGPEQMAA